MYIFMPLHNKEKTYHKKYGINTYVTTYTSSGCLIQWWNREENKALILMWHSDYVYLNSNKTKPHPESSKIYLMMRHLFICSEKNIMQIEQLVTMWSAWLNNQI